MQNIIINVNMELSKRNGGVVTVQIDIVWGERDGIFGGKWFHIGIKYFDLEK